MTHDDAKRAKLIARIQEDVDDELRAEWPGQVLAAVAFVAASVGLALIFAGYFGG